MTDLITSLSLLVEGQCQPSFVEIQYDEEDEGGEGGNYFQGGRFTSK